MTDDDIRALIDTPEFRADVSAVALTAAFLNRLESYAGLRAMITLTPELALAQARAADTARSLGKPLPLDGMPIVVKDNVDVAGVRTTVGSRLFAHRVAVVDAAVTERLRDAGAVILGKANLHELAFGGTSGTRCSAPSSTLRRPTGSRADRAAARALPSRPTCASGRSAPTQVARCGSRRRSAASLGCDRRLVPSRAEACSRSASHLTPLAHWRARLSDVRALTAALAGYDPCDPRSADEVLDLTGGEPITGLRVGVIESLVERSHPEVATHLRSVAELLQELGARLSVAEIHGWQRAVAACGLLIKAEALEVYADVVAKTPELLEDGTRQRLALAAVVDAEELRALRAEQVRFADMVEDAASEVDALLLPTIPVDAPAADGADTIETTPPSSRIRTCSASRTCPRCRFRAA